MKALYCLAPLVFLGLTAPTLAQPRMSALGATSSVTFFGTSAGRLCFEAAQLRRNTLESLDICNRALSEQMSPRDTVSTYVNRGIVKMLAGDMMGAIADYDQAIAMDPNEADAYVNKGMAVLHSGDNNGTASLALFTAAIEKGTRRPAIAYYGRGVANELVGNSKAAYADYVQATTLEPTWEEPKTELSRFKVVPPPGGDAG